MIPGLRRVALAAGACVLLAGGCSAPPTIQGKVIAGNLSFVAVVNQNDERLSSLGLAEVDVTARTSVNRGGMLIAETETDEKGGFTLKFREQSVFTRPVEFGADAPGYRPARGEMIMPPPGKRLLIILTPSGRAGEQSGSDEKTSGGGAAGSK